MLSRHVTEANPTRPSAFPPAARRLACSTSWLHAPPVARSIFQASLFFAWTNMWALPARIRIVSPDGSGKAFLNRIGVKPDQLHTPARHRGRSRRGRR